MARQGVTLMCYWNGRITSGPRGISYEGATPKPIRVSYGITYNELLDTVYGVSGFDKHQVKLKITCRYPACREYIPVPIDDDESIDIMFDVARQPGTNCMELYLERVPVPIENQVNVTVPAHTNKQTPVEKVTRDAQVDSFLDPGPVDNTVLVLQNQHRSAAIWEGEDPGVLTCRQSAVLAYLYRELCRASKAGANEIAGPLILLQLWAWERLHIGRPERLGGRVRDPVVPDSEDVGNIALVVGDAAIHEEQVPTDPLGCRWRAPVIRRDNPLRALIFYRDQLDQQTDDQMIWQPYTTERLALLPDVCVKDQHVWQTIAPLICFDVVEWHRPDRVLRQFGLHQGIPKPCDTEVKLHSIDRRGRHHYDWRSYHGRYIQLWEACEESIAVGESEEHPMYYHDPYMEWYRKITRRLITPLTQRPHMRFQPSSGTTHLLVQSLTAIHNQCATILGAFTSDCAMRAMKDIQTMCIRVLQMIGETRHLETRPASCLPYTNNMEGSLRLTHEEVSPLPATTQTTTKAPSARGRSRGKSKGRGRGRPHTNTAAVAAALSESFLPPVAAPEAVSSHDDDSEGPSYLNQKEAAPPEKSIYVLEGEKVVEKAAAVLSEAMHLLECEKEVETASPPPSEPTYLLESEKEVEKVAPPSSEPMHLLEYEKWVDTATTQPQDGPMEKLAELTEESRDLNRPQKKSKHV
nr:serine/threonine-protein phosphatase 7 long form like [Quercus suber]